MADYFETGFTVRERSWHGKELLLDEHPENWDDARMAAGLMWEPRMLPLYFVDGVREIPVPDSYMADDVTVNAAGERVLLLPNYIEDVNARRVERDDTSVGIGTVSGSFELLPHADMGPIMEAVLDNPAAKYDTAGSVRGGRTVYAVIRLDEPYTVVGDLDGNGNPVESYPYLVLLNSHDGTGACKVLFSQVRVVCWNTVQAASADGDRHGRQFSFRHTAGMKDRIEEAREALVGARADALRWREMAGALASMWLDDSQVMTFVDQFLPEPPAGTVSDRVRENVARDRGLFLSTLRDSPTNSAQANTGLGLVNAAVEYLDHFRGYRNQSTYMGRQLLRPEPLKAKAISLVRSLVKA